MTQLKKPGFPWLRLVHAVVSNLPPVKEALATTLNGLERQPELLRFVEQFQTVDQKDCLICLAYRYGAKKGVTAGAPPEHWCPEKQGAGSKATCGCGRPAVRKGTLPGVDSMPVCELYPGCLPAQKVRSKR